jgi:hypothetical protein
MADDDSSAIGHRPSAIGHRPSALGHRPSAIGHRPLLIGQRPNTHPTWPAPANVTREQHRPWHGDDLSTGSAKLS